MYDDIFEFDKNIPIEIKPEIESILRPLAWLLPPWCQVCSVYWEADGSSLALQEGAAIDCSSSYTYRRVALRFFPCWLSEPREQREAMCIHDILHTCTGILFNFARNEISRLIPEDEAPKYRSALMDELEVRHESMTQDLCYIIANQIRVTRQPSPASPEKHS